MAKKSCKRGYYYCYASKKCKRIPGGYRVGLGGYLRREKEEEKSEDTEAKKNSNGNGGNGNGNHSNGNGNGNGSSSNGGGDGGGGGVSEGWSRKYKKSIDCDNPKGFSQKAHCQGKMDEQYMTQQQKAEHMARRMVNQARGAAVRYDAAKKAAQNVKTTPGSVTVRAEEVIIEKSDGKSSKDKGYSLRDWFKGGGWKQTGGKYDGKPCAKQPGQKTKPYCRDADDRAAMSEEERNKRARKKRKEDPNPNKKGRAKNVTQESYSNWRTELDEGILDFFNPKNQENVRKGNYHKDPKTKRGTIFSNVSRRNEMLKKLENQSFELEGEMTEGLLDRIKSAGRDVAVRTGQTTGERVGRDKFGPLGGMIGRRRGGRTGGKAYDQATSGDVGGAINTVRDALKNSYEPEGEIVDEGKKDACYHKVKSRYSVWPSAYASGALVKCRKVGAKNWGNKSESYDFSNWRDDFQATEIESIDLISNEPLKPTDGIGSRILDEKCWSGYEKKGMKTMFGKRYPNCVKKKKTKKEDFSDWRSDAEIQEDWQKSNRKDNVDGMSQKSVNAYKRENPGSKLKTAVTGKVEKGSKDSKRRKSFCARSNGQRKMHNIDCSKTPDKKICKARKRWRC